MRTLQNLLGRLLVFPIVLVLQPQLSTLAQPIYPVVSSPEYSVCYLQIDSRTLHLDTLCGNQTRQNSSSLQVLSSQDERFIAEYKGLLKDFPEVQKQLLPEIQQNPQALIARAANFCQILRNRETETSVQPMIDSDILTTIAPQYYCQDMDD